jgi:hypothetical protein
MWQRVLTHVKADDFESAYRLVLRSNDDMYLLRLMLTTKCVVDRLDPSTAKEVLAKVNKIIRNGVFEN